MIHQLKITSYAFIVALVPFLFLSSQATAIPFAGGCPGWDCFVPGQYCPYLQPGASSASYMCTKGKWVEIECIYEATPPRKAAAAMAMVVHNPDAMEHWRESCITIKENVRELEAREMCINQLEAHGMQNDGINCEAVGERSRDLASCEKWRRDRQGRIKPNRYQCRN